ncbi:MAG: SRPBCC family protein [Burkholderiales bacterium]
MLKIILATMALALAAVLLFATMQPDTFRVACSARIAAAPDKIFPLINDLHASNRWSPFVRKDPQIKLDYSGPAQGVGAACAFDGNREVGKGRLEITQSSAPHLVAMHLRMLEPIAADNRVRFTLEPDGNSTRVTWAMEGDVPTIGKLIHRLFNMDRMIGADFDSGLASLRAMAEGT